ncbi:MAG: MFS transporter [Chloroflexi bacterium]|nr:MFS transporter [Chloroflexota bacterium]
MLPLDSTARRKVIAIIVLAALWAMIDGLVAPVLPLYIASVGGRATDVGLANATNSLAKAFVEPAWGWSADRLGAAGPLALSRFLSAAIFTGFLLSAELWWIWTLQFGRGLFEIAHPPIGRGLLGDLLPPARRGLGMGIYYTVTSLARGGVGFLGGVVVDRLGYRVLFTLCAALGVLGGVLTVIGLRDGPRRRRAQRTAPTQPAPANPHFVRQFVIIAVVSGLGVWSQTGFRVFMPLQGAQHLGLSATEVGLLFTIQGFALAAFNLPSGGLADRFGRTPVLLAGLGLSVIAIGATGFAQSFLTLAVLTLATATGQAAFNPARTALISDIAPAGRMGLMLGIFGTAEDIGMLGGPLLGGIVWDRFGSEAAFLSFAAASVLAIVCTLVAIREKEWRRQARVAVAM